MTGAYDCNYDFVDDPKQALVEAHEEIRELESQHADEIARLRLTADEREAIEFFVGFHNEGYGPIERNAATLRTLLERLK